MPFYEYRSRDCGHEFESMRPMADRDHPCTCPKCESTRAARKLSTFSTTVAAPRGGGCSPAKAASCGNAGFG
jgi:putative FmdB family regulatory protein